MSRLDAITQYENALKAGKKYYNNALSKGEDPYPEVLDEKVNLANVNSVNVGIVDIPQTLSSATNILAIFTYRKGTNASVF